MPFVEAAKHNTIGIVGTRRRDTWDDYNKLVIAFDKIYTDQTIISGGCPQGGDRFAEIIALSLVMDVSVGELWKLNKDQRTELIQKHNVPIRIYGAEWDRYGKAAGLSRNGHIASFSDVLLAIRSEDRTGGTEDTIAKMLQLGKKVIADI